MGDGHCQFCDRKLPARPEGRSGRPLKYCKLPRTCKQQARARRTRIALQMLRRHRQVA